MVHGVSTPQAALPRALPSRPPRLGSGPVCHVCTTPHCCEGEDVLAEGLALMLLEDARLCRGCDRTCHPVWLGARAVHCGIHLSNCSLL